MFLVLAPSDIHLAQIAERPAGLPINDRMQADFCARIAAVVFVINEDESGISIILSAVKQINEILTSAMLTTQRGAVVCHCSLRIKTLRIGLGRIAKHLGSLAFTHLLVIWIEDADQA